ncbi:SHOCT domain-containing protein [Streptomyces diacarni]|uniref:SHOCT domain-containing protein n=1 Tax=Streptomyces diacarni TaxID=2800381 RepID=UPI0034118EB9
MDLLAHWHDGGGPGPWILFFPLVWAAVVAGGITLLRRTAVRGRRAPWQPRTAHGPRTPHATETPLDLLGRRFARGEIDEDEYWRRTSVLRASLSEGDGDSQGGRR